MHIADAVHLESECMSTLTLKNVKKIYPFNGDDAKKKKKKKGDEPEKEKVKRTAASPTTARR